MQRNRMMTITANGKKRSVHDQATVADLLREWRLAPEQVVIEHNGEALARDRFASTKLRPHDVLEIAQMVGGG